MACVEALRSLELITSGNNSVSGAVGGTHVGKADLQNRPCFFTPPLYFRIFLLECNVREVRVAVATILEKTLDGALFYQDKVSLVFTFCLLCLPPTFKIARNKKESLGLESGNFATENAPSVNRLSGECQGRRHSGFSSSNPRNQGRPGIDICFRILSPEHSLFKVFSQEFVLDLSGVRRA